MQRSNVIRLAIALVVLAAGGAAGWLIGHEPAEAAEPIEFLPATAAQANPFTPAADHRGSITITAGQFGGSGSNLVCDRKLLLRHLRSRPNVMRAWAEVLEVKPTIAAVERYIRSLRPSTLLAATRVTNHSYKDGKARDFQSLLGPGTAVLVDREGAIRVRCRCGNPLLDPVLASEETCENCPANVEPSTSWQLGSTYYATHPAPPPAEGQPAPAQEDRERTMRVVGYVPASHVVEETVTDARGREETDTTTVPAPPVKTVERTRIKRRVRTVTRTVTVAGPTVTVPGETVTVTVPQIQTVERVVTVPDVRTVTVYTEEG